MIIPVPGTQQSLSYDSLGAPLHSTCDHDGGFHS